MHSPGNDSAPFTADTETVVELIAEEEHRLRYMAYCITHCLEASKIIVLDLKIRILERDGRHRFNSAAHLRAHLYIVLRNLAIDWLRQRNREVGMVFCDDPHGHPGVQPEQAGSIDDPDSHAELFKALKPYLRALTEKEVQVFEKRFLGAEFQEIACLLRITEATAKKHHSNAVKKLRRTDIKGALS